tara:strand:- start:1884 stop:2408 length:525 start_codon:yes stop_codon:yes gene_type:complete
MLVAIILTGCASQRNIDDVAEIEEWNPIGLDSDDGGDTGLVSSALAEGDAGDTLSGVFSDDEFGDPLSRRVVYFEYDSNTLTPEAKRIVEAHANYLISNPDMALVLEGHADERGTREYNLALGESRSKAVAEIFLGLGVNQDAIRIISYGEERPVDLDQNEAAWSLNRRVEILY